jgi:hypothetical protein
MTLQERIAWVKKQGWEFDIFETVNDTICLQAWSWAQDMHEWEFSISTEEEISTEKIYQIF